MTQTHVLFDNRNQDIDSDTNPDLSFNRVRKRAEEALNSKVLFDPFKEEFDLPALAASFFFQYLLLGFPITTQPSAWYWEIGLAGAIILLALTGFAAWTLPGS